MIILYIVLGIGIFLMGFAIGRRIGIKQGYSIFEREYPLTVKMQTYENGECPICKSHYYITNTFE
jgi:hypothetical protein